MSASGADGHAWRQIYDVRGCGSNSWHPREYRSASPSSGREDVCSEFELGVSFCIDSTSDQRWGLKLIHVFRVSYEARILCAQWNQ